MKFLPEYVILPEALWSSGEDAFQMAYLRDVILRDGILRDLRDGQWGKAAWDRSGRIPDFAKQVLKSLKNPNRLIPFRRILDFVPTSEGDWCAEALATHQKHPLDGIIASDGIAKEYCNQGNIVCKFDDLIKPEWSTRSTDSIRVPYCMDEYLKHLSLVLSIAPELRFIDPYIDPGHREYKTDFPRLLLAAGNRRTTPSKLEIHRKCKYKFDGKPEQDLTSMAEWQKIFQPWHQVLGMAGVVARVVIWDDFKVRFFSSELLGLHLAKGFKTNGKPKQFNVWNRLSRADRDAVNREFDVDNSPEHSVCCQFEIGWKRDR